MTLIRKAISATIGIAMTPVSYTKRATEDTRHALGRRNASPKTAKILP